MLIEGEFYKNYANQKRIL